MQKPDIHMLRAALYWAPIIHSANADCFGKADHSQVAMLHPYRRKPKFEHVAQLHAPLFEYHDGMIVPPMPVVEWIAANMEGEWSCCLDIDPQNTNLLVSFAEADDALLFKLRWEGQPS